MTTLSTKTKRKPPTAKGPVVKAPATKTTAPPVVLSDPPPAPPILAEKSFAERIEELAMRAIAGEGNTRQAEFCLRAAESLERLRGQYEAQADAVRRTSPLGSRSGIRLSHLSQTITRTIHDRDRYVQQAEDALNAAFSPPITPPIIR